MYAIPNNRAGNAFEIVKPWEDWAKFPIPKEIDSKKKFEAWRTNGATQHAFISGVGGLEPRLRISEVGKGEEEANPPATICALVADYDEPVSDEKVLIYLQEPAAPIGPNFICDSFSAEGDSGRVKRRLVWLFEVPIRLAGSRHAKSFYKVLGERLCLKNWLPGFDAASHRHTQYFEIGRRWTALATQPIPKSVLYGWAAEASADLKVFDGKEKPAVALELIAGAVAERFPGRWSGDFALGSQGVRFWDPAADNDRAAVVRENGMVCFTGTKPFVSWEEIFGEKFIDGLRGDQWGKFLEGFYWDGRFIWHYNDATRTWVHETLESARRIWRVAGISSSRGKGGASDIDRLESMICSRNLVHGALPFVHRKPGELWFENKRYLNTTDVRVLVPMDNLDAGVPMEFDAYGGRHFPWIRLFLRGLFEPPKTRPRGIPEAVPLEDVPLFIFLAYLKRCYEGGYYHNPLPRQAVVLAGPEGAGKTFLVTGIMATLLGPVAEGSSVMVEGKDFNSTIMERPINFIDDATPAASADMHRRFTAMLKKMTSNTVIGYNKKYGAQGMIIWRGCTILACNLDPESQRSMPSLDHSNLDKLSMYQIKRGVHLPGEVEQQKRLDAEMPAFARFLLEWQVPEWVLAPPSYRGRFGIRSYHHAELREAASATGVPSTVLYVLRDMYEDWREADLDVATALSGAKTIKDGDKKVWEWTGRSTRLYRELANYSPDIVRKLSSSQVDLALSVLSSKGFGVTKVEGGLWKIRFDEKMTVNFDPTSNTEY